MPCEFSLRSSHFRFLLAKQEQRESSGIRHSLRMIRFKIKATKRFCGAVCYVVQSSLNLQPLNCKLAFQTYAKNVVICLH